jgi:hypothetical protein
VNPLNQCCTCGEDFASLAAFDAHILSKPVDPKFDCLQVFELRRYGWVQDARGRWQSPDLAAKAASTRKHFRRAA